MIKVVIYGLVVIFATLAGSAVGLGGGVVIKPVLDIISNLPTEVINFYSSLAVFSMSVISMGKHLAQHYHFDKRKLLSIAGGSVVGGLLGQELLQCIVRHLDVRMVHIVQSILLCLMLTLVFVYSLNKQKVKHYHLDQTWIMIILGLFLGAFSVFLGIGGGPLNVSAMMILFSFSLREAAVYSVGIIFFAQMMKMVMVCLPGHQVAFQWPLLIGIVIAALIGGYLGTIVNQKVNGKVLNWIYNGLIGGLILVTLFNIVRYIFAF